MSFIFSAKSRPLSRIRTLTFFAFGSETFSTRMKSLGCRSSLFIIYTSSPSPSLTHCGS